ncbi:hypothetical protein [Hoylesella timonensis]|uniref:hypothetical protein n=1 Tax=Hoylesella timonensis TaxID=386414 RepID=UPI00288958B2|nr:hypothetical protein [Hoylesella timonensis]
MMISKNEAKIFFFFLRAWTLFISEKPLNLSPYQQKTAPPPPLEDVEEATHEKSNMIDEALEPIYKRATACGLPMPPLFWYRRDKWWHAFVVIIG